MTSKIRIHYDNGRGYADPRLWVWYNGSTLREDLGAAGSDAFGPYYEFQPARATFGFQFKDGTGGPWEGAGFDRRYEPFQAIGGAADGEVWCVSDKAFMYPLEPRGPEPVGAAAFLRTLAFKPGVYVPGTGGFSGLGATPLADGRWLFGLYHPNAGRIFLMGSFNGWQRPAHDTPDPTKFIELKRYTGYFGAANTWLAVVPGVSPGDEYKFNVIGGVPRDEKKRYQQYFTDPYARQLGPDYGFNNSVVVDPTTYAWTDASWRTPEVDGLILYEMSVYGFTEGDPDITASNQGKFAGIAQRVTAGYFDELGVTALSLMPLAEVPTKQGPSALGYDPSLFCTVERDFGTPDDLRALVDAAHAKGLAVLLDQVFNHTSNPFNPLWQMILEHPDEEGRGGEGGLYFSGSTMWGNRVATEKEDVQNLLIDACKLALREYHVDGFRFDATHTDYMDHGFLQRLADELKGFKPDVLLVCENLPNQADLNRAGFDGFAQWCDPFHDRMKAFLREGPFENNPNDPANLPDIFYFCKGIYAAHTNNVVNYCESHDEHSVPHELSYRPETNNPATKERKGRLGLLATATALGQPMIYMGQEFNVERPRNVVTVVWPGSLNTHGHYQWARRLLRLRRRYPGLRLRGYDPAGEGRFAWVLGPWMGPGRGGGRRVIGWRARPNGRPTDAIVVLLNFEIDPVRVDVEFGIPGHWVKLADIDRVNDIPGEGTNSASDPTALHTGDGWFAGFELPSSSGFIYKWEAP